MGHGGMGTKWNQLTVLNRLMEDASQFSDRRIPQPKAVLVTGDVAFSGGAIDANNEYASAAKWLKDLAAAVNLGAENVYLIPGNHDVDRKVCKDDRADQPYKTMLLALRSDAGADLDDALQNMRPMFEARFRNYVEFTKEFAPPCRGQFISWEHTVALAGGELTLSIIGLNSALLCQENDNKKLRLGQEQLHRIQRASRSASVRLVMTHHPLTWMRDDEHALFSSSADIHLCGHVHVADFNALWRPGGAGSKITVIAGASHGDNPATVTTTDGEKIEIPSGHGYNLAAIGRDEANDGGLFLRVWPRRWYDRSAQFFVDGENADRTSSVSATHRVALSTTAKPRQPTQQASRRPTQQQMMDEVFEHLPPNTDRLREYLNALIARNKYDPWLPKGAETTHPDSRSFIRHQFAQLTNPDLTIDRVYAIDLLDPTIWLNPLSYYWLSLPAREFVARNYDATTDSWNILFSEPVDKALARATSNIGQMISGDARAGASATRFDDQPPDDPRFRHSAGSPGLEVARILIWTPEDLRGTFAEPLILAHSAFNIPLFFLPREVAGVEVEAEFLVMCNKGNDERTNPSHLFGTTWTRNDDGQFLVNSITHFPGHPLKRFHRLLSHRALLFAADAKRLVENGLWEDYLKRVKKRK
jgi:3',5'-cyclic AMP phosphodiesterase CpdA